MTSIKAIQGKFSSVIVFVDGVKMLFPDFSEEQVIAHILENPLAPAGILESDIRAALSLLGNLDISRRALVK